MREILFRGKRIDNGEWAYGYVVEMCDETDDSKTEIWIDSYRQETKDTFFGIDGYTEYSWRVDPTTIGEYTGRKDKNGTKIFEGDIMEFETLANTKARNSVRYDKCYSAFMFGDSPHLSMFARTSEVIGNIHDKEEA